MLGLKRQPTEEWATWNKRSLRHCRLALFHCGGIRWSSFVLSQIWTAVGHICRGDPVGNQIFGWRSLAWWEDQKNAGNPIKHASRFNAFMDIDRQLSDTAGKAWAELAHDRSAWANLEGTCVSKYDVPWSSGKQSSLTNLAPNPSQSGGTSSSFVQSWTNPNPKGRTSEHTATQASSSPEASRSRSHMSLMSSDTNQVLRWSKRTGMQPQPIAPPDFVPSRCELVTPIPSRRNWGTAGDERRDR